MYLDQRYYEPKDAIGRELFSAGFLLLLIYTADILRSRRLHHAQKTKKRKKKVERLYVLEIVVVHVRLTVQCDSAVRTWDQSLRILPRPRPRLLTSTIYFISKLTENTAAYREYTLQLVCIYLLCHTALVESTTNHAALWPSCESWRSHAPFTGPCTLLKAGDEGYCLCYCFYSTMIKKRPPQRRTLYTNSGQDYKQGLFASSSKA